MPVWSARWRLFAKGIAVVGLPAEGDTVGRVAFGRKRGQPADPATRTVLVSQPGQTEWVMTEGQWFEHLEVVGPEAVGEIFYAPDRRSRTRGVLGVVPPPSRAPVDDELRRRHQGVPGVAGGE